MAVLVVLILVLALVWLFFTQIAARTHAVLDTPFGAAEVERHINEVFGGMYKRERGPGTVNVKRKLAYHAPLISVDYDATETGCAVEIWTSDYWKHGHLLMNGAQQAWRKKRKLAAQLITAGAQESLRPPRGRRR